MNIIGQEHLLSEVDKIFEIFIASESEIKPHFILTGASGTGKSITIKSRCEIHKLGYLEVNAAQLTKEGTSGNSLSKALSPILRMQGQQVVCFVDEFDKLFISGNSNSELAHETTNGVQNEFLKVLESDVTQVYGDYGKYLSINSKDILFVFAGAFNGEEDITLDRLRDFGVKTEFLGRVGLVYNTVPLTLDHLFTILDESPLLDKYLELFEDADRESVVLHIKGHLQKVYQFNTIGARAINTMISQYFIKGGKLEDKEVKEVTFQKKLSLK